MDNISVIISSCDKYSYLWDIQLQLFDRYWPTCPYPVYMLSENSKVPSFDTQLNIKNFNTGKQSTGPSDWSDILIQALQSIDSEYIIYLQEDYVFTRPVDSQRLNELLDYVKEHKCNYVRFYTAPPGNGHQVQISEGVALREITPGSQWRTSLMVAVWRKETLQALLESAPGINPWSFEQSINSDAFDKFYCIDLPEYGQSDILPFIGIYGSSNGYSFYPVAIELLEKEGVKKLNGENINYNIKL